MTLLSICLDVADDLGVDRPQSPIMSSNDEASRRFKQAARRAARSLHREANWVNMVIEHTFTAAGQSDFDLPPDFAWMVDDTLWERSRYWALRGAMSPQKWQTYKSSIYGRATIWRRWRIRIPSGAGVGSARKFSIDPQISSTDNSSSFVFEYVSAWWCRTASGAMAADWTGDNDTAPGFEQLIELGVRWRIQHRLGLDYSEDKDEYEREVGKAKARDGGGTILDLVPSYKRDDFIGQYTLGAFPPGPGGASREPAAFPNSGVPPALAAPPPLIVPPLPGSSVIAARIPLLPSPPLVDREQNGIGGEAAPPPPPVVVERPPPGRPLRPTPPYVMPSEY